MTARVLDDLHVAGLPPPRLVSSAAPARRAALAGVGALASGLALAAAFEPIALAPLAPLSVALFTACCRRRRPRTAAGLGLLAGLAFFVPLLAWERVIGADAWLLLAGAEAVFIAALGAATALVTRLPGWPAWVAAAWVGQELVRDRLPFGGFPWGRLAFSQAGTPYADLAAWGGAPLVTFAVALTGALLLAALDAVRRPRRAALVLAAAVGVAAAGLAVPVPTAGTIAGGPPSAVVAAVQGNVPRLGLDAFAQQRAVLDNSVAATLRLAARGAPRPDLVIWPENATDIDPFDDAEAYAAIAGAVQAVGVPVLVGAVLDGGPGLRRNVGLVWDPVTGPGQRYQKRHPVPFGEYVPFRSVLTHVVGRFAMVPRDVQAGTRPGVLRVGPARLADVICFEVAYDGLVRAAVRGGGRLLVVQTNNATYADPAQTEQQLAMSRLRAVEHGRAVVIAATSGISAVIDPAGRVVARTEVFTPALLVQRVALRDGRTLADRLGAGPELLLGLVAVLAVAAGARRPVA